MTDVSACFSDDVMTARGRFLAGCDRFGLRVSSFKSGSDDPDGGGPLWADVTRLGSVEAQRAVVLCAAAGGPAGFAAAGVATGVLKLGLVRDLPRDVALILVHAVNPTGPVWPLVHPMDDIGPVETDAPVWNDSILSGAEKRHAAYRAAQRFDRERLAGRPLAAAAPPAWDRDVLETVSRKHLAEAGKACFVDIRTGPGQYGVAETLSCDPKGSAGWKRARRWFDLPDETGGDSIGPGNSPPAGGLPRLLGKDVETTTVLMEVGTYSMQTLLHSVGGGRGRSAAYPTGEDWRESVWNNARGLFRKAFAALSV